MFLASNGALAFKKHITPHILDERYHLQQNVNAVCKGERSVVRQRAVMEVMMGLSQVKCADMGVSKAFSLVRYWLGTSAAWYHPPCSLTVFHVYVSCQIEAEMGKINLKVLI